MTAQAELPEAVRRHYPWAGRDHTLRSGHRLHYLDEGTGEVLLMVHGNPTWSFYWRNLVAAFSDRYRCVVPDHLGCGLSDKPQDWSYRLQDHVANLVELIDALDLRDITLVVHDWGGAIGFGAALERTDRIRRLVVFNTAVFMAPVPLSIRMCRWPVVGSALVRGLNGFARAGNLRAISDRGRMSDGVGTGYLAPYDSWSNRIAHLRFVQDIPLEPDHPTRPVIEKLHERAPELADRPALIVWGERDFVFTMAFLDTWRGLLPDAEVHTLPDAAHYVVEDAHERIVPLMEAFLGAHPLS